MKQKFSLTYYTNHEVQKSRMQKIKCLRPHCTNTVELLQFNVQTDVLLAILMQSILYLNKDYNKSWLVHLYTISLSLFWRDNYYIFGVKYPLSLVGRCHENNAARYNKLNYNTDTPHSQMLSLKRADTLANVIRV